MSIIKEFREFAIKGNVVDMAIGVIIGAAFGKIVSSLVSDMLTPPLGILLGGVDFKQLQVVLASPLEGVAPATIRYGIFIQACFDFLIVAFAMFMVIKLMNRYKKDPPPAAAPPPTNEERLLTEIRDILKSR